MKFNFFWGALILALLLLVDSSYTQISKTFRVVNKTGFALTSVRISQSNANEWGLELNTMEKMPNGSSFEFGHKFDTARCMYDMKFSADDATEYYMKDVNFCQLKEIVLIISEQKGNLDDKNDPKVSDPSMKTGDSKTEVPPDVKTEQPPQNNTEPKTEPVPEPKQDK